MLHRLERLSDEVRLMFHAMSRVAELAHRDRGVTPQMRAVLSHLDENGSTTVPRIAHARGVSRQHIQTIVNELLAEGLVEQAENPAHRRSWLVVLTPAGQSCMDSIAADEAALFADLGAGICADYWQVTVDTLASVRSELDTLADTLAPEPRPRQKER